VESVMDKIIGKRVYRLVGNVLAANFIRLPVKSSHSLSLTGRYLYAQIRPMPQRYFAIHIFIVAHDDTLIDVSITNLSTECRTFGNMLQYPCSLEPKVTSTRKSTGAHPCRAPCAAAHPTPSLQPPPARLQPLPPPPPIQPPAKSVRLL
jgi:hypothetical protein